jgi:hypothetical protein
MTVECRGAECGDVYVVEPCQALRETMPTGRKPLQILTEGHRIRSIHGTQYARLWNEDLVKLAMETDFSLPHEAVGGGKGL